MKRSKTDKSYLEMAAQELAEETKQFDQETDLTKSRPLTEEEKHWWARARGAPARSIFLRKSKPVTVRLDETLLRKSDEYAARHGMTRSEVINKSLEAAFSFTD